MPKARRLLSNMTKGQASPLMQGRPDLQAYFEMASQLTNFQILRQGGVTRRPGTRYVADVKVDANDTILLPFEVSVNQAYAVEMGNLYGRFYANKAPILTSAGGVPVEVVTPYLTADLRLIHYTQSADVLFLFHGSYPQTTLNHVSDTNWSNATTVFKPPPSFEQDTDISAYSSTVTVTIATPAVVSWTAHGIAVGTPLTFSTTGALPTGLVAGTTYYVIAAGYGADAFEVSATLGGAAVNTSGSQSGVHTANVLTTLVPGVVTITIASPGVVSWTAHGLTAGTAVKFSTTGALPTGLTAGTTYYVLAAGLTANAFEVGASAGASAINTSGSQSGIQACYSVTAGAVTGNSITFTAAAPVFLAADVGRQIIVGASVAVITAVTDASDVVVNILVNFPWTTPIAAGNWLLHLSPQAGLTPSKARPVGTTITMTLDAAGWRPVDVNKYVTVYGGLVQLNQYTSTTVMSGIILSEMGDITGSISKDPAGGWSLQVPSWSVNNGYPRTGEFFQGRLGMAGTAAQPTTLWLSATDGYNDFAIGSLADNAVEYTIASRQLDRMEWLGENIDLYLGTTGAILRAQGGSVGAPIGGDVVPLITRLLSDGCAPMQPVIINRHTLYMDRNKKKFFDMAYSFLTGEMDSTELTAISENIFGAGAMDGQMAFQKRPDPRIYWVGQDGSLITLTYYPVEKVIGFTRFVTAGAFQSCTVIPGAVGESDQVWVIVQRTVNGQSKRYVEMLETNAVELTGRNWTSLQTDCASVFDLNGTPTTTFSVPQLNGLTVDVIADGVFIGQLPIVNNIVTLPNAASNYVEIGLDYVSTGQTMRPALQDAMIEGLPRSWDKVWLRVDSTVGGQMDFTYNKTGAPIQILYPAGPLDTQPVLYSGDTTPISCPGSDTDARISFIQNQPYPMTVLAIFGELTVGEHG